MIRRWIRRPVKLALAGEDVNLSPPSRPVQPVGNGSTNWARGPQRRGRRGWSSPRESAFAWACCRAGLPDQIESVGILTLKDWAGTTPHLSVASGPRIAGQSLIRCRLDKFTGRAPVTPRPPSRLWCRARSRWRTIAEAGRAREPVRETTPPIAARASPARRRSADRPRLRRSR